MKGSLSENIDESVNSPELRELSIYAVLKKSILILMKKPLLFLFLAAFNTFLELISTPLQLLLLISLLLEVIIILCGYNIITGKSINIKNLNYIKIISTYVLALLLVIVGLVLFVVPGLIFSFAVCVAVPVCMFENRTGIDSIKKSIKLTRGYKLKIFFIFLVVSLLYFIFFLLDLYIFDALSVLTGIVSVFMTITQVALYTRLTTIYVVNSANEASE